MAMIETNVIEENSTLYNEPTETEEVYCSNGENIYPDLADAYYGRLYIPELSINVALYNSNAQYVTDRIDSANVYRLPYSVIANNHGWIVADHNYQEFSKLFNVRVGTQGYIIDKYHNRIDIECIDVFNGHNNKSIVDENGQSAMRGADYMMYTCRDHWTNILICLWEIKSESDETTSDVLAEEFYTNSDGVYVDLVNDYYGRLYIPDLNINVALYYSYDRYVTDRVDSANIFFFGDDFGYTITDHNSQEFAKLFDVKVGITGYIQHRYNGRIDIECVDVFNGYNNGRIVDENGVDAMNRTDYMMYTCKDNETGVLICLWERR
jgi:sortase (surface protein transpeptidase)